MNPYSTVIKNLETLFDRDIFIVETHWQEKSEYMLHIQGLLIEYFHSRNELFEHCTFLIDTKLKELRDTNQAKRLAMLN